jgi:hypothetical protein
MTRLVGCVASIVVKMAETERTCKVCGGVKLIQEFPHTRRKSGRVCVLRTCIPCHRQAERERMARKRQADPRAYRDYQREYTNKRYQEDPEYRERRKSSSLLYRLRQASNRVK